MSADAVIGWVLAIAVALRLSRAKTLADLVEAATPVGRGTLCAIGRRMWDRIREPPERLVTQVVRATLPSVGNWG